MTDPVGFIRDLAWSDVPAAQQERMRLLLADFAAVSVAGRATPAAAIAAGYSSAVHPGDEATALLDGRRLGVLGAAWANGVLANALDLDDGHRLTKGHPGAMVTPGALAVAQLRDATQGELFAAIVIGYEISVRAGIALHARDSAYHGSGAWGSVGVAAASARLLGLDPTATATALAIAEYHAPLAPITVACAEPAMVKDACGWGAWLGVSSALLAARGFTSVSAEFLREELDDLGTRWAIDEIYVKAHPCCRWSQGAIRAALSLVNPGNLASEDIEQVTIRTFAAAAGLAKGMPRNTEEAQYSLVWPVAVALSYGRFDVTDALGPYDDPRIARLVDRTLVVVDDDLSAAFPAHRQSSIAVTLRNGAHHASEFFEARGEPDDPGWADLIRNKVATLIDPPQKAAPSQAAGLRSLGPPELVGLLCR